jgi:hypothetical protein
MDKIFTRGNLGAATSYIIFFFEFVSFVTLARFLRTFINLGREKERERETKKQRNKETKKQRQRQRETKYL